jgi:hypothetical protein
MTNVMIPKGSKEFIPVQVESRLGDLSSLIGLTTEFRIDNDKGVEVVTWAAATTTGMTAFCLVDTSLVALPINGYDLYLRILIPPEAPILGPFRFEII